MKHSDNWEYTLARKFSVKNKQTLRIARTVRSHGQTVNGDLGLLLADTDSTP